MIEASLRPNLEEIIKSVGFTVIFHPVQNLKEITSTELQIPDGSNFFYLGLTEPVRDFRPNEVRTGRILVYDKSKIEVTHIAALINADSEFSQEIFRNFRRRAIEDGFVILTNDWDDRVVGIRGKSAT